MSRKFDHLFHEFVPQETNYGAWCRSPQAYFNGDADIEGANLTIGFQVFTAPVLLESEPHFHREEEYLIFLGAVLPDVFSAFDAEIEVCIGKTLGAMEKVVVTKPTIIRVPKGYWHSPLNFKRVTKPVMFQSAVMHGKLGTIKLRKTPDGAEEYIFSDGGYPDGAGKEPAFTGAPYWTVKDGALSEELQPLVCELPKEETKWGDWCPTPQAYFRGETYMPGANFHVGFQTFTGQLDMEDAHFHQGADEYIFFMGADPMNILDFDAEIDFYIGDSPDGMELYKITKPTVVMLPPTVWHSPILFRNVKKPVLFQAAFLAGCWGTITRRKDENGVASYHYQGDNIRFCVKDPSKRCTVCGECYSMFAPPEPVSAN
jgi:hypothetical protein